MNKNLKIFLIIIGAFSILYSIYGLFVSASFLTVSTGIIVGAGLISNLYLDDKKEKK